MIEPINQRNYEEQARKILSDLFFVADVLKGAGIDITPVANIMETAYIRYIAPEEIRRYEESNSSG